MVYAQNTPASDPGPVRTTYQNGGFYQTDIDLPIDSIMICINHSVNVDTIPSWEEKTPTRPSGLCCPPSGIGDEYFTLYPERMDTEREQYPDGLVRRGDAHGQLYRAQVGRNSTMSGRRGGRQLCSRSRLPSLEGYIPSASGRRGRNIMAPNGPTRPPLRRRGIRRASWWSTWRSPCCAPWEERIKERAPDVLPAQIANHNAYRAIRGFHLHQFGRSQSGVRGRHDRADLVQYFHAE